MYERNVSAAYDTRRRRYVSTDHPIPLFRLGVPSESKDKAMAQITGLSLDLGSRPAVKADVFILEHNQSAYVSRAIDDVNNVQHTRCFNLRLPRHDRKRAGEGELGRVHDNFH